MLELNQRTNVFKLIGKKWLNNLKAAKIPLVKGQVWARLGFLAELVKDHIRHLYL